MFALITLSPRLQSVLDMIPHGSRVVADVGCNHGYLSIAVVDGNRAARAIASDVSQRALEIAIDNVHRLASDATRIETRLGDGLRELREGEADVVAIAGCGVERTRQILDAGMPLAARLETLVVQPVDPRIPWMHDLRRDLVLRHELRITDEHYLHDQGRHYMTLRAEARQGAEQDACIEDELDVTNLLLGARWHSRHHGAPGFAEYLAAEHRRVLAEAAGMRRGLVSRRVFGEDDRVRKLRTHERYASIIEAARERCRAGDV